MKKSDLIIVRGAGDLATGTIHRLKKSGFHLLVLETDHPAAIRRQVALSEAVYSGSICVENVEAVRIESVEQMRQVWEEGKVPVLVDPKGESIWLLNRRLWWMRSLQRKISEQQKIWHRLRSDLVLDFVRVKMWMW